MGLPRVRSLTPLTPMKPFGAVLARLLFAIQRTLPETMGIRELKAIYFTRWSVLTSFPYNGPPQIPERPPHPYLVWETDYNGVTERYIETFTYLISRQINLAWFTSYGFPHTRSVTELKNYIEQVSHPIDYHYCAYPDASVRMILSALEVAKEHRYLVDQANDGPAEEFAPVYRSFLQRRQADL